MKSKRKFSLNPFVWASNAALKAVGFHDWKGQVAQPIPPHFAVKSIYLLELLSIPFSFFVFMLVGSIGAISHIPLRITPLGLILAWSFFGVSFTVAQAVRIARLNARTRRYRLSVLERKVEREETAMQISAPMSRPLLTEPTVSYLTQGIS